MAKGKLPPSFRKNQFVKGGKRRGTVKKQKGGRKTK